MDFVVFLLTGFTFVFRHNGNLFDYILEIVSRIEDMHSLDSEYFVEEVVYLYFDGIIFLLGRIRTAYLDLEIMGRLTS